MIYNEDEVKELFEVVFKLSAKDVNDKLVKVRNRPEIAKRRWFWELLQNAKDAVKPEEKVSVKLILGHENGHPFADFQHNGNPFRYEDAKNLIFPYSDKDEEKNSDKSGRFGTGFLATHILSNKIQVKGVFLKDTQAFNFYFTLDRSGADKSKIAESINDTWQQFRDNRSEIPDYQYSSTNFETSFKYPLDTDSLNIALQSINDFDVSLPFALAFIPKIQSVEIVNQINNSAITYFKNDQDTKQLTANIKQFSIEKRTTENGQNKIECINLILCSDGIIDIAIEIYEKEGVTYLKEFVENQPLLFCPFPLISANDFKYPIAINSISLIPKEERDGVWLGDTGQGKTNQLLIESVKPLYFALAKYVSSQNWKNTYILLKSLKENLVIADFNANWFKEKVQSPLKEFILKVPLIDNPIKGRISIIISESEKVRFPRHIDPLIRERLWELRNTILPQLMPPKEEIHQWYNVLWDDCPFVTLKSLSKFVAGQEKVDKFSAFFNNDINKTLNWLNILVELVSRKEPVLLNDKDFKILPDQFGRFKLKDTLWLDDDTIDQELKEILADIAKIIPTKVTDWRLDMLDKRIFLDLPATRTRTIAMIGTTISDTIKELLRNENPTNELRDLFSRLLNWLHDNQDKAKEYFKGLRTESLLYKTANESKIKHITEILQNDRDGKIPVEQLVKISESQIAMLQDHMLFENIEQAKNLFFLMKEFNVQSIEELREVLEGKADSTQRSLLPITEEILVAMGITNLEEWEDAMRDTDLRALFDHRSVPTKEMFVLSHAHIDKARKRVIDYLNTLTDDYNLDDLDINTAPTILAGVLKHDQPIKIVFRPAYSKEVIVYYTAEKDTLDYANTELWVDDGVKVYQISLGYILKTNGIKKFKI